MTHTIALAKALEKAMKSVGITESAARDFQAKLPQYDPRRGRTPAELEVPTFHITTENKVIKDGDKKIKTKVLAIHTSVSASNLIYKLVSEACHEDKTLLGFIPAVMARDIGRGHYRREIEYHKKKIDNMSGFAIYGLTEETLHTVRQIKDGEKMTLKEFIIKKTNGIVLETTNFSADEGKHILILKKKNMEAARSYVSGSFLRMFKKYAKGQERIQGYTTPRMSLGANTSPLTGAWKHDLQKNLLRR